MCDRGRQQGVTLIELIVFMVIVGVALAGMPTVFNLTTRTGVDPMIRKQMLAIAEGLMDEVAAMPFTWCDPDDPAAATAINAAACATPRTLTPGCLRSRARSGVVTITQEAPSLSWQQSNNCSGSQIMRAVSYSARSNGRW